MRRLAFGLVAIAALALASNAGAQQQPPSPGLPSPRINHVSPCGAKAGASVEVSITGYDLDEPTGLLFSHSGIKGEYLPPKAPAPDPKKKDTPKAPVIPPTGPFKFKITVDANVPFGLYDLRVVNQWGVSNPRTFAVGEFPEVLEKEPNNDVPEAQKVDIGTTVNGVITAGTDVDYTLFSGKKGQRVLISCLTSSLDSKAKPMIEVFSAAGRKLTLNRNYRDADALADVLLPEDGDYLVRLFEFTYLAGGPDYFYRLTISTAPWIDAVYPHAIEFGKPTPVTIYGRNLPNGTPSGFTIDGKTLEKATVTITPPTDPLAAQRLTIRDRIDPQIALQDGFEYSLKGPGGTSNSVPIYFTREKAVLKKNEGGTRPETAEALPAPCEVIGMIHKKSGRDWYSFEAKKGDLLYLEVTAERNGRPADFFFNVYAPPDPKNPMAKITDIGGGEIDDETDQQNVNLHPTEFFSRTGDPPAYKFTAPADGKFLIAVGCRESSFMFGPQTSYRLRVGPPRPDFRAVIKAYSKSYQTGSAGRQDGTEAYEVFAQRMDGFNGPIALTVERLPAGVTAKPTVIGPGTKWTTLVLNIAPGAAAFTGAISVKATGTLPDGKPLVRDVRPAGVVWGTQPNQNIPVVSRLSQTLVLAVRPEKAFFKVTADPANATIKPAMGKEGKVTGPIVVKQGDKLTLPVKASWLGTEKPNIALAVEPLTQTPQQSPLTIQVAAQPTMAKPDVTVNIDVKPTAPPGVYTVVLRGDAPVNFVRDPKAAKPAKASVPVSAFSEPVEITVIPVSVAKLTPGQVPGNAVKAGATAELTLKIDRLYDFAGEYKVSFTPPKGLTGVTAADVTVPAGKDEAKIVFKAAADAKPGAVAGVLTVTAVYDKTHTISHETKVNFTVAPADKKKK